MLKTIYPYGLVLLIFFSLVGCGGEGNKQFATKEDSLVFAKSVMETYEQEPAITVVSDTTGPFAGKGMSPITPATVKKFSDDYDRDPKIFDLAGKPYQGFHIDPAGYAKLLANPKVKGLYLRFGKKADGAITIMVLGTDANGKVLETMDTNLNNPGDSSNFDSLAPCPDICL